MPATREAVLKQLDGLIAEGRRVAASYSDNVVRGAGGKPFAVGVLSSLEEPVIRAFVVSCGAAVARVVGTTGAYHEALPSPLPPGEHARRYPNYPATALAAVLALRRDVEAGLLESLERRVRADVEFDFLEQAEELLGGGYHAAAMVLVGGVLEDRLRTLCDARALPIVGAPSLSKLNEALYKAGTYDKPVMHRIQSIAAARNHAAHGGADAARVQSSDATDALGYVRKFLADH